RLPAKAMSYGRTVGGKTPQKKQHRKQTAEGGAEQDLDDEIPAFAARAIEAATKAGAERTAGAVESSHTVLRLLTSTGTRGIDEGGKALLNVRAFAEGGASGHGLSCSASLSGLDPEEAGRRAGEHAKMMKNAKPPEEGTYEI